MAALLGIGPLVGLIIIVLLQTAFAFFGHNLVQAFERWSFPVLAVIFAVASLAIFTKSHFGAPALEPFVGDGPSVHGETDAFRAAGRHRDYRSTIMVTTLSPCWYCSGLVRQFNIGAVAIGEARTFSGGHDWLAENGVSITLLDDERCVQMMTDFIAEHPELWAEDIRE